MSPVQLQLTARSSSNTARRQAQVVPSTSRALIDVNRLIWTQLKKDTNK